MIEQLFTEIQKLDDIQQQRLLNYVRILTNTPKIEGESGVFIADAIGFFDAQSLDEMEEAIKEGCETVDWHDWE
jgi:hypothetical protein